jgi:hypothetical protein
MINNPIHHISQHSHFRNSLNSCRRRRNNMNWWHLVHHVFPLDELATSSLKHKIDYTQSHTQPWRKRKHACMYIKWCLLKSSGTCRTLSEGSPMWLLDSSWRGHGNSGNTPFLRVGWSLLCCLSLETWLLPKGRQREGEEDRMNDYFCVASSQKFWCQKMAPKHSR